MQNRSASPSPRISERVKVDADLDLEAAPELQVERRPAPARAWPEVDRRVRDRRARPTRFWDGLVGPGRRAHGRRASDRPGSYVDRYGRGDIALVVGTFVLNLLDAFLTLRWIAMGGSEENPLMDQLLQSSEFAFLLQKCAVVGVLLLVLIIHRNFALARLGLWVLFLVYAGVLILHGNLQWSVS